MKCYTSLEMSNDKKNPDDFKKMMKVRKYLEIANDNNPYFLGQGSFGTVMSLPWDDTKMVKAIIISQKSNDPFIDEIFVTYQMSKNDISKNGDPRFAPRISQVMCINRSRGDRLILIFGERFMGDMARAVEKDRKFQSYMLHMGHRVTFYYKMFRAFELIFESGYKHCDIKPDNILYTIQNGIWDANNKRLVKVNESPNYIPVFTDFGLTVNNDVNCKGGTLMFMVPAEAKKEMEFFDTYRKRAELFAVALTVLWMETNLMSNLFEYPRNDDLTDLLNAVGSSNGSIKVQFGTSKPIQKYRIYKILEKIMTSVGYMNKGENDNYSYEKLEVDLNYVRDCLVAYFKYYSNIIYPVKQITFKNTQINAVNVMAQWYFELLDFIITMCRSNDVISGRPSIADTIEFLANKSSDFTEISHAVIAVN